jgi:hypothetical protein
MNFSLQFKAIQKGPSPSNCWPEEFLGHPQLILTTSEGGWRADHNDLKSLKEKAAPNSPKNC